MSPIRAAVFSLSAACSGLFLGACSYDVKAIVEVDVSGLRSGAQLTVGLQAGGTPAQALTSAVVPTDIANNGKTQLAVLGGYENYLVTVTAQPEGQVCVATFASGDTDASNDSVNTVTIICADVAAPAAAAVEPLAVTP